MFILFSESRVVVKPWVAKKDRKDSDEPPPEGSLPTLDVEGLSSLIAPGHSEHPKDGPKDPKAVPFPDSGIVMKSLNYVELDILNTSQAEMNKKIIPIKSSSTFERKPNIVMNALSYIEHDVKGLL